MSAFTAADNSGPITRRQILVVFSGLMLAMLLAALDQTIVSTALPTIVGELGGLAHLSWVVTAYLLAQTVVTPLYGKLGDLVGRKRVMQSAIVIFLVGSALCGMSRTMTQLIVFRALQGLGGGGLMVTSMAVVADVVPPRDRGRYQGIFGAVFGVASIAGPLLGGYFTTHLSWRWIFYINLPLGALALAVLAVTLPAQALRTRHEIDYAGAAVLATGLTGIVLACDLGGTYYSWTSPQMIGLVVVAVCALAGFVFIERRAAEPVLPLRLFANGSFTVSSGVGLVIGVALFGAITYLPLYLQVVRGASPTASGLEMLPMMGGMLITSIGSGQLISRTGRYRVFPIAGTAVMTCGLFLLSRMTPETSTAATMTIMMLLGLGLGMVMQVLVIAVQNAVAYRDLGVATSGATLFRLIGGSIGTAALGAIFAARLEESLQRLIPAAGAGATGSGVALTARAIAELPPAMRAAYTQAFTSSLTSVFLVATAVGVTGVVLALMLPEKPLRATIAASVEAPGKVDEVFAMPADPDSGSELLRGLAALADRDLQRRYLERLVAESGAALSPAAAWLLIRAEREPGVHPVTLAGTHGVRADRMGEAARELLAGRLVEERPGDHRHGLIVTPRGCEVLGRLVAVRRQHLVSAASEWSARTVDGPPDPETLARELVPDAKPASGSV